MFGGGLCSQSTLQQGMRYEPAVAGLRAGEEATPHILGSGHFSDSFLCATQLTVQIQVRDILAQKY